jgi:hypothetical protein
MCALALLLSLTACQAPGPDDWTPTPSPSPTPVDGVAALYGDDALFLSEFIERFPAADPLDFPAIALFEAAASGPASFNLPTPTGTDVSLVLAIFCDAPTNYEVAIVRDNRIVDRTWGDNCPQSGIVLYTTAPISGPVSDLQAKVTVNPNAPFRVSILQRVAPR